VEEMALIAQAIAEVSAVGGDVAMWWIVMHYGVKVTLAGFTLAGVVALIYFVTRLIYKVSACVQCVHALHKLYVPHTSELYEVLPHHIHTLHDALQALKARADK
jgi:hypothetical protein